MRCGFMLASAAPSAPAATDPLFAEQWALTSSIGIGAAQAWTRSDGTGVLVAVLDSGVQVNHPDLAGSIWTNPAEIPGNGRDDDNNRIVDDVNGANMLLGTNRSPTITATARTSPASSPPTGTTGLAARASHPE